MIFLSDKNRFRKMQWRHVIVGDFVHLSIDEVIPADILLIRSSDTSGICFVETSNLDGETSLKQRRVPTSIISFSGVLLILNHKSNASYILFYLVFYFSIFIIDCIIYFFIISAYFFCNIIDIKLN